MQDYRYCLSGSLAPIVSFLIWYRMY